MTLEQVLDKYDRATEFFLHERKAQGKSQYTLKNYRESLRYFRDFFVRIHDGEEEVKDPGYLDFQKWRDEMLGNGMAVLSTVRHFNDMHSFYSFVTGEEFSDLGFYDRNPISRKLYPSDRWAMKRPYEQILTDEQVSLLWKYTPNKLNGTGGTRYSARNYAIVVVLLSTEIRNAELLDLKLSDLDFEYEEIQIWKGKGNKYRCVDFPKIAQTAVKLYLQSGVRPEWATDDDYLFGTSREKAKGAIKDIEGTWHKGSSRWLSDVVKRHVKKVTGVDNVTSHDLRHVGSRLDLHNGMETVELQAKLGHSEFQTTQIYCGKLGTKRKRISAREAYRERDAQTERNLELLEAMS